MRRLVEWKLRSNNTAIAQQTNDLYKDRFLKLARHIEDCYDWSTIYYISEWELDLEYTDDNGRVFSLDIDVNSNNITVVVLDTNTSTEVVTAIVNHNEWSKLLDILKNNGIIQNPKLCECYDLPLLEWTYQQNPVQKSNASATNDYTEKFRDMLEYHVQNFYHGHTHAKLVKHNIVKVAANCFLYEEHVTMRGVSWKYELAVAISLTSGDWVAQGFKDGQMTSNQSGTKGFEELFDYLRDSHILVLPYNGTNDYKKLVEDFKENHEMTLYEEFIEYEQLWEDTKSSTLIEAPRNFEEADSPPDLIPDKVYVLTDNYWFCSEDEDVSASNTIKNTLIDPSTENEDFMRKRYVNSVDGVHFGNTSSPGKDKAFFFPKGHSLRFIKNVIISGNVYQMFTDGKVVLILGHGINKFLK